MVLPPNLEEVVQSNEEEWKRCQYLLYLGLVQVVNFVLASPIVIALTPNLGIQRNPSNSKKNDRLQERLAKAVVNRNGTKVGGISASSSALPSRTGSPLNLAVSPRISMDKETEVISTTSNDSAHEGGELQDPATSESSLLIGTDPRSIIEASQETSIPSLEPRVYASNNSPKTGSTKPLLDVSQGITRSSSTPETANGTISSTALPQYEEIVRQMRSDHESAELRHQEEAYKYIESIDVLQAKLQYLTKEAAEIAKKAGHEAEAGSIEQKLAMKDEKIALLLEEGQKLSQNELKHMNIIRKLRVKSTEDEKRYNQVSKRAEESEKKALLLAQERVKRAEIAESGELERMKALQRVERELDKVKIESDSFVATIKGLHEQLADAKASSQAEEASKYKKLLESERKLASDLRDNLSNSKLERELSDERHRSQIRVMQEKFEKDKELSKTSEQELKSELRVR